MAKRLKKFAVIVLAAVVVILVAFILFINLYGDKALKMGIEKAGEMALKVDVRVKDLSLAILAGKLNIDGLAVDNPQGYEHPTFLEAGQMYMALNTKSLLSDTIEISQIKLDGINVVLEQKGLTNNIKELLANLPKTDAPAEPKTDKPTKKVVVKELELTNVNVKISLIPGTGRATTLSLPLAPIRLTNLGQDGKMDAAVLVKEIISSIAAGIAQQGKGLIPNDILDGISGELGQLMDVGKDALNEAQEAGKGILEQGKNIGDNATGLFKGLIPKKDEK